MTLHLMRLVGVGRLSYAGQMIYLVWNTVNDPLIGGWSDGPATEPARERSAAGRRLPALRYGGPLLCLVFLLVWVPIGCFSGQCDATPSPHAVAVFFVVATCSYDGLFTYVQVTVGRGG